jgi:hypothetical protein
VKLDLKAVLGAGPPADAPAHTAPPATPGPASAPPTPAVTEEPDAVGKASLPKLARPTNTKPASRERVAVNVPGELLDFVRTRAADDGDYLTDVVLEALARHGGAVVQAAKDKIALRARPPRRSARQRAVKHPTLLVLYLSGAERRELDEAASSALMTRSAFVAELLTVADADEA